MANAQAGVDFGSLSDDELRELRRSATQEMRRRGLLPPPEEKGKRGGGKGKRQVTGKDVE